MPRNGPQRQCATAGFAAISRAEAKNKEGMLLFVGCGLSEVKFVEDHGFEFCVKLQSTSLSLTIIHEPILILLIDLINLYLNLCPDLLAP